jgi:hypothetical protein
MGQFVYVIRKRIKLPADQAIFVSGQCYCMVPQAVARVLTLRLPFLSLWCVC